MEIRWFILISLGGVIGWTGCARYDITVQGVNFDRLSQSLGAGPPAESRVRAAAYHNDLGVILEKDGELEEALRQYKLAQEIDPTLTVAYVNAGNACLKLNNYEGAVYYYQAALEREPDNPRALNNLAWAYLLKKENLPEAIGLLRQAIAADPEHRYQYLDSLGWARYLNGEEREAIAALDEALLDTPPEESYLRGEAYYHLGMIYRARGESRKAAFHFEEALGCSPSPEREREINGYLPK